MSVLDDVAKFLRDLILGDFAEDPSSVAVLVNGAIGLIPVVDQILDVRDITGCIYRCSRKGWKNLGETDYADLAFAAIGVIPEFGSAFKGAVKPLWKERKLVGRGVQNGIAMLERLLGSRKGGVIKWLREINWAGRTQQAIARAQDALGLYIRLLEAIAADPWWAPTWLAELATGILPEVRDCQSDVTKAIQEGSRLIHAFLDDLLGEHAVWVAVAASATPGQGRRVAPHHTERRATRQANQKRKHDGGKAADPRANQLRDKHGQVGGAHRQTAQSDEGLVSRSVQRTRDFLDDMKQRPMGLIAEHHTDYHVLNKLGGGYVRHGVDKGRFHGNWEKVNGFRRPVELLPQDLVRLTQSGIDSLWKHKTSRRYRVVEAKGRVGAPSDNRLIAARTVEQERKNAQGKTAAHKRPSKIPPLPQPNTLSGKQAQLWRMLHDTSDKGGMGGAMQMSVKWIKFHLNDSGLDDLMPGRDYDRFVYLVTEVASASGPAASGVADHLKALGDAVTQEDIDHTKHEHTHGISVEYDETDIAKVEALRSRTKNKKQASQTESPSEDGSRKPSSKKPTKRKP